SALALAGTYFLGAELFGRRTGAMAAALLPLWPPFVAINLIFYPGHLALVGISACCVLFLVRWERRGRRRDLALAAAWILWGLFCRPMFILFFTAPVLIWAFVRRRSLLTPADGLLVPAILGLAAPRYLAVWRGLIRPALLPHAVVG